MLMEKCWNTVVPGSIYEMYMNDNITLRLLNRLLVAYSHKFNTYVENSKDLSLEKILLGLNILKPEDALKIEKLGKKSVEDLRLIWPL